MTMMVPLADPDSEEHTLRLLRFLGSAAIASVQITAPNYVTTRDTLRALVLLPGVALTDGLGGEEEVAWGERVGGGTVGGHGEQSGGREGGGRGMWCKVERRV